MEKNAAHDQNILQPSCTVDKRGTLVTAYALNV